MPTARFEITGLVQGVGFRFFTVRKANSLGLTGYAKNMPDGSVNVFATGELAALRELHNYLQKGPERSYVKHCYAEYLDEEIQFEEFERL